MNIDIHGMYYSDDIRNFILDRLHYFRDWILNNIHDEKEDIKFKIGFTLWDMSSWGLRFYGKNDEYYLDKKIKVFDKKGLINIINKKTNGKMISNNINWDEYRKNNLENAWENYSKQIFRKALAMKPFYNNFEKYKKYFKYDNSLFHEAILFPYPNFAYFPLITLGTYKAYITVFYNGDFESLKGKIGDIIPFIEQTWEEFEIQLFERLIFEFIFRRRLEPHLSVLASILSIIRPALAILNNNNRKYILYIDKDYNYQIIEKKEKTEISKTEKIEISIYDNNNNYIKTTLKSVQKYKKLLLKDFFEDNKWTFIRISISNIYQKYFLQLIIPYNCSKDKFEKNLLPKLNMLDEKLRYIFYQSQEVTKWSFQSYTSHIRSAVAAIMARNMSHQQGSAVIPYLTNQEESKIFIQYLKYIQQRMDFIASAATLEFPKWGISVYFFKDLVVNFISQYGLLHTICQSEGYYYNTINFNLIINNKLYNLNSNSKSGNSITELIKNDIKVFIPGGYTGMHAFYLILENILRNSAKYNKKSKALDIYIKIENMNDSNQRYKVVIWDSISKNKEKVNELNGILKESLIDETGKKREYAWGLAEMRICASYLATLSEREAAMEVPEGEVPIKAIANNDCIGYEFYLLKPKLLEVWNEQ